jgi:8-oxo-dGTP diphosphatase
MATDRGTRIGAFAIIRDDEGKYLSSLRRDMNLWNLPGGGVEPFETPWVAVEREVEEETGLSVEVVRLQGIYAKQESDTLVFSFECAVVSGELVLTDEAREHRFFSIEELPPNFPPKQRERLMDFECCPTTVTMKTQTLPSSREHLATLEGEYL